MRASEPALAEPKEGCAAEPALAEYCGAKSTEGCAAEPALAEPKEGCAAEPDLSTGLGSRRAMRQRWHTTAREPLSRTADGSARPTIRH